LRSFTPHDFIQLPPLGEAGTLTLVEELALAAAQVGKLSPGAHAALERLLEGLEDLKRNIAARERAGSAADPHARAADRQLDDAWAAFQSWLLGWTHLPDRAHPQVAGAKQLYAAMFPKGLQFLTLDFKDEWTESQRRLDTVVDGGLVSLIDVLGGRPFLDHIAFAHRAYGDALHITANETLPDPDAHVRRGLEETHLALRDYVAQVAAMVRRNDPTTIGVARRLLAPLADRSIEERPEEVTLASAPTVGFSSGGGDVR
jgi:hypothetical protein